MAVFSLVALLTGCAGTETTPDEASYSRGDLVRFVTLAPQAADWGAWREHEKLPPVQREDLATYSPTHESQGVLADAQEKAGFDVSRTGTWLAGDSKASSFATLFASADGARDANAAAEEFAHAWFADVERREVREVQPDGLGDDAWGVRGGRAGAMEFVELGWRQGNMLLGVYLSCADCAAELEPAAGAWAEAIAAKV